MKKAFSAIFVFIALCVLVAFGTLRSFDQKVRSEIITRISEKTGRPVSVDGNVKMNFSLSPSVDVGDIKLSAPSWSENPYLLQIGSLEMQIELLPLFHRQVKMKRLLLKDVALDLEINRNGEKNWLFSAEKAVGNDSETKQNIPLKKSDKLLYSDQITLENARLSFIDLRNGKIVSAQMNALEANLGKNGLNLYAQGSIAKEKFNWTLDAEAVSECGKEETYKFSTKLEGKDISIDAAGTAENPFTNMHLRSDVVLNLAKASALNNLLQYSLPELEKISVKAKVNVGADGISVPDFEMVAGKEETAFVQVKGTVDSVAPLSIRFQTKVEAPNMGAVQGLPDWPPSEISVDAVLRQGILIDRLKMMIGRSDLSGRIFFKTDNDVLVQTNLHSNRFELANVLGKTYSRISGNSVSETKRKGKVFSSQPLPFDILKAASIDVDILIDRLIAADGTELGKVNLKAAMHDGIFNLPALNLADSVLIQAVFDASKQPANASVGVKVNQLPLSWFFVRNGIKSGAVTGEIRLNGQGSSEAEMAASLNGKVFADVRNVYVKSLRFLSLPEELAFLMPINVNQPLSVSCAVINVPIKNGLISSRKKIGMENNILDMQLGGNINLASESLDLNLEVSPHSQGVLSTVFNSVTVDGTLAAPQIKANKDEMFGKALSIGRAFFFGGKEAAQETMRQQRLQNICAMALAED